MKLVNLACAGLLAVGMTTVAAAGTITGPAGTNGNDWTQEFCSSNCSSNNAMALTEIEVIMQTPGVSLSNATSAEAGWSGSLSDNGGIATLSGPADLGNQDFTLGFSSPQSTPFTIAVEMWDGATFDAADSGIAYWNGSGWTISALDAPLPTPEPAAFGLLAVGLLMIGGYCLRRRRVAGARTA